MIITFQKPGYFRLQSGSTTVDIDPVSGRTKADVVLRTSLRREEETEALSNGEVGSAGEYEMRGVEVRGFQEAGESSAAVVRTVYLVAWEDVKFAVLGALSRVPEAAVVKEISEADIIFVPTAGPGSIPAGEAAKLVRQLEPSVVIPSHFKNWQNFAKELGAVETAPRGKFVFKKKELVLKEAKLVVLEG